MKALIYGKPGCKFCEQAKILCFEKGIEFDYKQLDVEYVREDLNKIVPNFQTFPQVFINGDDGFFEHVGGYSELKKKMG